MRTSAALLVAVLSVGACSPDGPASPDPTVPTAPASTTRATTAVPADPFAIPAVIDDAYVNRVLAALDAIDGETRRRVLATGSVDPDAAASLRSIYNDPLYPLKLKGLAGIFDKPLDRYKSPPGDRRTTVIHLVATGPSCAFAEVRMDYSNVVIAPPVAPEGERTVVAIQPTQAEADPGEVNPTPWSMSYEEVLEIGAEPQEQPCAE